jgi:fatty-acyl-CoA synthase
LLLVVVWVSSHEQTIDKAGWLHTGDLATMDAQGYVNIVGRIKDMIIRGGENVYPREVEEYLYKHPAIAEVQIFGVRFLLIHLDSKT